MQPRLDSAHVHPFERNALPAVRVERSREANRVRRLVAVEIERPPARPAAISFGQLAPFVLTWKRGQLQLRQALDHRHAGAAYRYSSFWLSHQSANTRTPSTYRKPPQVVLALDQRTFPPSAGADRA